MELDGTRRGIEALGNLTVLTAGGDLGQNIDLPRRELPAPAGALDSKAHPVVPAAAHGEIELRVGSLAAVPNYAWYAWGHSPRFHTRGVTRRGSK